MANPIHPNFSLEIVKHVMCLDGKNFTPYKHNMNLIFRLKNLSGFVEGRVPKPAPILAAVPALIGPVEEADAGDVPHAVPVITNAVPPRDQSSVSFCYLLVL